MQHENVVFDYRSKVVSFDREYISENCCPIWYIPYIDCNSCLTGIFFQVDDKTEYGIIDTGADGLYTRQGFAVDDKLSSVAGIADVIQEYNNALMSGQFKKSDKKFKKIENLNIKIGSKEISDILSAPYNVRYTKTNKTALTLFSYISTLGYTVWNDQVFQLDFKNWRFFIE